MTCSARAQIVGLVLCACLCLCSCSEHLPDRAPTYPVTGQIYVDGQPAAGLQVECHSVSGMDSAAPTVSATTTDPDGKFAISTYLSGDGVPEGEYRLTFVWRKLSLISRS